MVVGILVALCAGIAICHTHHNRQRRMRDFKSQFAAENGRTMTKAEWKQLCREHKQAWKAEKHARKAEKHMRRAERRGCWRTSYPALPAAQGASPDMSVRYADGNVYRTFGVPTSGEKIQIPVQGPDEPPAYMPGSMTAPPEKM